VDVEEEIISVDEFEAEPMNFAPAKYVYVFVKKQSFSACSHIMIINCVGTIIDMLPVFRLICLIRLSMNNMAKG